MLKQLLKGWFETTPPSHMAAASITLLGPIPGLMYHSSIGIACKTLKLNGWLYPDTGGDVEMHVEGPQEGIVKLLEKLRDGSLLPCHAPVEMMWLPYKKQFNSFKVEVIGSTNPRVSSSGDYQ